MSRSARRDKSEKIRAQVASLVLAGATQTEIANTLGMSVGNVNYHLQKVRKVWRKQQMDAIGQVMLDDLVRVQTAIGAIWANVLEGDVMAIESMRRLIVLRGEMLGYKELTASVPSAPVFGGRPRVKEIEVMLHRIDEGKEIRLLPPPTPEKTQ